MTDAGWDEARASVRFVGRVSDPANPTPSSTFRRVFGLCGREDAAAAAFLCAGSETRPTTEGTVAGRVPSRGVCVLRPGFDERDFFLPEIGGRQRGQVRVRLWLSMLWIPMTRAFDTTRTPYRSFPEARPASTGSGPFCCPRPPLTFQPCTA
jgi:hypothetical protein